MQLAAAPEESVWRLRLDIVAARFDMWLVNNWKADLSEDSHLYLFDRYHRLAEYHRRRGHARRARQLQAIADRHYEHSGGDPPRAVAIGMPRPRRWTSTDARARSVPSRPRGLL